MNDNIYSKLVLLSLSMCWAFLLNAQEPLNRSSELLTHWMTPDEWLRRNEIGRNFTPTDPPSAPVTNIAEFNYNEGVLIRYPFGIPMTLIKELSNTGKVLTIVANSSQQNTVYNQYVSNGVNVANCEFLISGTNTYWTRDYGPWFIIDGNNQLGIVDFPYNRPRPLDDDIPIKVAQYMNVPLYGMNIVHTGGNYMCDGMGAAASTELVYTENPTLPQATIHQMVKNYLGVDNYHVRPDPNGTYIDHIDCWAKFLDVDKILIRQVPPTHPQYSLIEQAAAYWQNAISSYGTPYQVFRVNTPNDQPYTNSFIFKNKVFVPITGNTIYDNAALQVYQNAMPGYSIVGVYQNSSTPWEPTDALHCRTHELGDKGMLFIKHYPIVTTQPLDEDYLISAYIKPLSGANLISDSLCVWYSTSLNPTWIPISMTPTGNDNYRAFIPRQPKNTEIRYYIRAVDASPRTMNHPYIGKPDPHRFLVGEGIHPHIALSTYSIDTTLFLGQFVTTSFDIINIGYDDLAWTVSTDPASSSWLSSSGQGLIHPGNQTSVDVFISATGLQPGLYEGKIYVASNDPDKSLDSIRVSLHVQSNVGIASIKPISHLLAMPNPFQSQLRLRFLSAFNQIVKIDVFNTSSICVFSKEIFVNDGFYEFNWDGISNNGVPLPNGIYLLRVSAGKEVLQTYIIKGY